MNPHISAIQEETLKLQKKIGTKALKKAKSLEIEQKEQGYKWVQIDAKTRKLVKCQQ